MAKQDIDIGSAGNDGTGDSIRESFRKVNENFNELYAVFGAGGQIRFSNLSDAPADYGQNKVIISSTDGVNLAAKSLVAGEGISIDTTDPDQILITNSLSTTASDPAPRLGGPLNAQGFAIGKVAYPSQSLVTSFNAVHGPRGTTTTIDELAISKGYADSHYIKAEGGVVVEALRVRDEPTLPQIDDPDYAPSLNSNYVSSEALPRKNVVFRGGDSMTGPLYLNDHPGAIAGVGTPNGIDDLQAATKYYVDNSTYSSAINLYVTTKGDDTQALSPKGKEGRFWNYAYRTVGAAALAADNLISVAQTEPGPYRQRLAYTQGPSQTFSTISDVSVANGNSADFGYVSAFDLLRANKEFIQYEVIAYINNKYVNTFTYNKAKCQRDIGLILDAVANDLVFGTNFNSVLAGTKYYDAASSKVLSSQLIQTIDAIEFARDEILNFSYDTTELRNYINRVIDGLCLDIIFQSNVQSIFLALAYPTANTDTSVDQIIRVLANLKDTLLSYTAVTNVPISATIIGNNINAMINIIEGGNLPAVSMPELTTANTAQTSARELLLANIPFIQAEVIALLQNEYPGLSYSATTCKRDIKFMVWSVVYDIVYGGNSLSIYAGGRYWINYLRQIAEAEVTATLASIDKIKTLAGFILTNSTPDIIYQQTTRQYRNETFSGTTGTGTNAVAVRTKVAQLFDIIKQLTATGELTYDDAKCSRDVGLIIDAVTSDLVFGTNAQSITAGLAYLRSYASTVTTSQKGQTIAGVNKARDEVLALVSDSGARTALTNNFKAVTDIIDQGLNGSPTLSTPVPAGASLGVTHSAAVIIANKVFLQSEIVAFVNDTLNPGAIINYDAAICFRDVGYVIDALVYDLTYGGNSATILAANSYVSGSLNVISGEVSENIAAYTRLQTVIQQVIQNQTVARSTSNSAGQNLTLAAGTSTEATIVSDLVGSLISVINGSSVAVIDPTYSLGNSGYNSIRLTVESAKTSIAGSVITFLNNTYFTTLAPAIADAPTALKAVRSSILGVANANRTLLSQAAVDYMNATFPVINDAGALASINTSFNIVINLLRLGLESRPEVTYTSPASLLNGYTSARELMLANIEFVQEEVIGYAISNYGSNFDTAKCRRDLKYIIEAIAYDITYGGNSASIYAGEQYWNGVVSLVPGQIDQTVVSINYAQQLLVQLVQNVVPNVSYQTPPFNVSAYTDLDLTEGDAATDDINTLFNDIKDIITNNTTPTATLPSKTTGDYSEVYKAIASIITTQKDIVKNDVTNHLDVTYKGGFNYDEAICFRDVGYIIEAMAIDLITDGTYQSISAGKSYYRNTSAKSIAIGTQYSETLDGILYAKSLALQVLNRTTATRYQNLYTQTITLSGTIPSSEIGIGVGTSVPIPSDDAITDFTANMNTLISIIENGFGAAPTPSFGTGIWTVKFTNGGNQHVDQGAPANNDILPAKVLVGVESSAYSNIVTYMQGGGDPSDTITCRLTKPAYYKVGEMLDFGESVKDLQIVIFVEAGIYYEDYPIKLATNVSIKGDEFRRTIIRPRDRISQSPWRKTLFYRDAIIDAMQLGPIDTTIDYRSSATATLSATNNKIVITLGSGQVPATWIGKVFQDDIGSAIPGKAIVDSVSGNFMNCSVIYPFEEARTLSASEWHIYSTVNYGRHYLTNPLDITSTPKNNKEMDIFLCNDATRISNLSLQGHGGFAMVLDPEGQIKTKSPYGQVCSSFSQSINRKRWAGGQFVDGFAGRLRGTIVAVEDDGKTLTITGGINSGLDVRAPQPPCAFYVSGARYQINDIVSYNSNSRTVVVTLDDATPWNGGFTFNETLCSRDVGLILDAVGYDIVYGSNYQAISAGRSYLRSYSSVVRGNIQLSKTISAIEQVKSWAVALSGIAGNNTAVSEITDRMAIITSILANGVDAVPAITYPNPSWQTAPYINSKNLLISNRDFIKAEITAWVATNYNIANIPNYNEETCARDVGYIVDALVYDVLYGGNSQTYAAAKAYYSVLVTGSTIAGEETITAAAYGRMKTVVQAIVQNNTVTPSVGNSVSQVKDLVNPGNSTTATAVGDLVDLLIDVVPDNATATSVVNPSNFTGSTLTSVRTVLQANKTQLAADTIVFLNQGLGTVINIEMGGNKSMLANDFAMINDLGYAIVAKNGGVTEQVSTFSYYCHTHYWAADGGQIRSVAGSNSHGDYGLRASGYDVTELPDAVTLANNMVQNAYVYKRGVFVNEMTPTATQQAIAVYILGYDYNPQNISELEIDHSLSGGGAQVRYEVTSVEHTTTTVNNKNVLKLNLSRAGNNGTSSVGLVTALYDGQIVTIRTLQNNKYLDIANVNPTRPSTALQYNDNLGDIYRVITYNLTDGTGELLPDHVAVLQTDTSFAYYKPVLDPAHVDDVDPLDVTKTMGSQTGDLRLAIFAISKQSTIDQLNKGIYIFGWNGRVHQILGYTKPHDAVTATYVPTGSSGTTLKVDSTTGIQVGDAISGTGFSTSHTVTDVNIDGVTLTISGAPDSTPTGVLTFTSLISPYLTINPVPLKNIAGTGNAVNALSYNSITGTGSDPRFVTYDLPWKETLPTVDSYLYISGNSNSKYNGYHQVVSANSQTAITVASTSAIEVGMVVTGPTIDGNVYVTSKDTATQFTVSPAIYLPALAATTTGSSISGTTLTVGTVTSGTVAVGMTLSGTNVISGTYIVSNISGSGNGSTWNVSKNHNVSTGSVAIDGASVVTATKVATLGDITINNGGSGYTRAPVITVSGGGALIDAIVTCTVSGGAIATINVVNPGYGYTGTPILTIETIEGASGAVLIPVLTALSTTTVTANAGVSTATATVAYKTDPSTTVTATATTHATATMNSSSISGTTLTVGTVPSGTVAVGMYLTGGTIPAGTYITANLSGSGAGSTWTVSRTVSQSSTTITGTNDLITVSTTTGLYVGNTISFSGTAYGGIDTSATTAGTFTIGKTYTILTAGTTVYTLIGAVNNTPGTTFVATGVGDGTGTARQTYYITEVLSSGTISVSNNLGGTNVTLSSASGTMSALSAGFGTITPTVVSSFGSKTGPVLTKYSVSLTIPSTAVTLNKYYKVSGNTNPLYNGVFKCTTASGTVTSITLEYPFDPGTWSTSTTTTITNAQTSATNIATGISKPFSTIDPTTIRCGYAAGTAGQVTTRISTCRATGHDFLDIGTGGYSTTNYPYQIYGNPAQSRQPENETYEEGVGRVFYVTTDQNGIFRVGRFFTVDQGTGTVTFSASIALSNLDGIGFKRGVVVSEFSTDNTMTNNAPDTVPVQSAVRGYIDKRLGIDHGGATVAAANLIGPGYLPLNGSAGMKGSLNANNNNVTNLAAPTLANDAATKAYVDAQLALKDQLTELTDVYPGTPVNGDVLAFIGGSSISVSATVAGDLTATVTMPTPTTLATAITTLLAVDTTQIIVANASGFPAGPGYIKIDNEVFSYGTINYGANRFETVVRLSTYSTGKFNYNTGNIAATHAIGAPVISLDSATVNYQIAADTIVNADVNSAAAIAQSKLALLDSTAAATAGSATKGISSFDSTNFVATNGFITIKNNSITKAQMANIGNGSVLANFTGSSTYPQESTAQSVLSKGLFQKFNTSVGAITYNGAEGSESIITVATDGTPSALAKYGTAGELDTKQLKVDGYKAIDTATNAIEFYTPGAYKFLSSTGSSGGNSVATAGGTWDFSSATLKATTITTGAPATPGSITGQYAVQASSQIDFTLGTLKSNNLTTGATGTNGTLTGQWALDGSSQFDATAGTLKSYTLTTGSSTAQGNITGAWSITGTLEATYAADLAEYYTGDQTYESGTVLVFGGEEEVTTSVMVNDTRVAGVVSTNAAYIMNGDCPGDKVLIALAGRVPCKVVGRVKKGDLLTTSATPGCAIKALDPKLGAIIGKALEDKDYGEVGLIEVAVGRA